MTPKEISEKVINQLRDYLPVEGAESFYAGHIEPLLAEIIGHEKQEWNRRCNEACEKQIKKVLAAQEKKSA